MKQSIPLFRILSMALLAGVLLFFSVQLYQYFSDPLTISPVYAARTEETISCPRCGRKQKGNRSACYSCGTPFLYENE